MKYISLVLVFIFLFNNNFATADSEVTATGSGSGYITQFYANRGGNFLRVKFSKDIVNPGSCEDGSFYVAELDDTDGANRFYSTVLAAFMAKKPVSFWISGCTEGRYWGKTRPRIWDIYVNE